MLNSDKNIIKYLNKKIRFKKMIVKLYKKMRIYKVHFRYYLIIIILLTDILETLQIKKTLQKLEKLIV